MTARNTGNFTSYLNNETSGKNEGAEIMPKLLPGELEAARAKNVLLFVAQKKKLQKDKAVPEDQLGTLIITNFRLSFILNGSNEALDVAYQENNFLGKYDVSLSNIEKIYQITDKKKRPVGPEHKNSSRVDAVRIICKNFRLFTFDFASSDVGKGKYIADALLRFAFPSQHNHLFLYHFRAEYYNTTRSVRFFNHDGDWLQELKRCRATIGANGWRIQYVDRLENPEATTLPKCFVVPHCLSTSEYMEKSRFFRQNRAAIWVWGLENASLLRMADLLETVSDRTEENIMLECVRKSDPNRRAPKIVELDKVLPSVQDIYHSYIKLMELCVPESDRQFMLQESRFYSQLEKSCWLLYVSLCLGQAKELSKKMRCGETIVLQETEGRDMCCVISCLIQLLLDPYSRTLTGFQTCIQKEWISLGHPFSDRMGHINKKGAIDQGPLFLLFLDCTWQLLNQFPDQFEFSETFLTTIWDSVFIPIFDTFQFNCEADRERAEKEKVILRPVWDWGEQFSDKDIALFSNPLYRKLLNVEPEPYARPKSSVINRTVAMQLLTNELKLRNEAQSENKNKSARLSQNVQQMKISEQENLLQEHSLEPMCLIKDLEIWSQCYFRWIPMLEIKSGGFPQVDLFNRMLVNGIHRLQKSLAEHSGCLSNLRNTGDIHNGSNISHININSFFPFTSNSGNSTELGDILTLNGGVLADGSIYDTASLAYQYTD